MARQVLLVEGPSDKYFFELVLDSIRKKNPVEVFPPDKAGATGQGVEALLQASLPRQMEEIKRGAIDKLGIVIDADATENATGFTQRYQAVANFLSQEGFLPIDGHDLTKGSLFQRADSPSIMIGLWVMPDHASDGIFEDFLLPCIEQTDRLELLNIATSSIKELKNRTHLGHIRFSDTHTSKVTFSTWLDWQKKPNSCRNSSPACAFRNSWINPKHNNIRQLTTWLTRVFTSNNP